ncbi:MAG TPA: alpha-L-fucosidase [Candidatus Paceibacterota bacterium]|nr:alpha-L-fucosidase [Verrucomicrobiota bacterium]HSA10896.1 alpha-L-fucosidase [Candidatus Paceibacterota bacterium]
MNISGALPRRRYASLEMNLRIRLLLLAAALSRSLSLYGADPKYPVLPPDSERLQWWRDARFGLFIHWGPVSLKGTEIGWSRGGERHGYKGHGTQIPVEVYDNLYKQFNPSRFNADEWVATAMAAGMRYLVFTSRHHDGFSMFDTQADDYKITSPDSPFRRDVVRELAGACHRAGLRFGLYYSQPNWRHPDAFTDRHTNYLAYLKTQVRELLTNYGTLDIFWFDGLGKTAQDYDAEAVNTMIRELQPRIIINNRNGLPEDHDTPEQRIGTFQHHRPWESCITICKQWAWKPDDQMKSLAECLETLIRCAGGDGNLLFNVGPMPDGRIEPRQVKRLEEMGTWLRKHGESIYGTRGGPWKPGKSIASTRKGNTIYLHLLGYRGKTVTLTNIPRTIMHSSALTGGTARVSQSGRQISISIDTLPAHPPAKGAELLLRRATDQSAPPPIDSILKLELDGSAMDLEPL